MPHTILSLSQAARHVCVPEKQLLHLALQNEVPCIKRGEQYFFEHRKLDDWAQQRIMKLELRHLKEHHAKAAPERQKTSHDDHLVGSLLTIDRIHPEMTAKTKPGIIRDMVTAAEATGLLNDAGYLHQELVKREELASTAIGDGAALLHTRYFNEFTFEKSFIVLGRTVQPIFFGSQSGEKTDIFFLICCKDDDLHLHILAQICILIHGTELMQTLREAETAQEMFDVLRAAENELLKQL